MVVCACMAGHAISLCARPVLQSRNARVPAAWSCRLIVRAAKQAGAKGKQKPSKGRGNVSYGADWYEQTRSYPKFRTVREELEYRREANRAANNGRERKDLYTDNWDGDKYKGSRWNSLSVLAFLFFITPVAGLLFAYFTYESLWG